MKKLLHILGLLFSIHLTAQTPTVQDCLGAISVCQQVYSETTSASGDGNYPDEVSTSFTCTAGELNSIWYSFTVNNSGNFGFLITPNNLNDDYDWVLYNITNITCDEISDSPSSVVSCNAAGGGSCDGETGATGGSSFNNQGGGCGSNNPNQNAGGTPYNELIPVLTGNTYVLMVSNWSGSNNGYSIDFGLSEDIGVLDNTLPFITDLIDVPDDCNENTFIVEFSEPIQCSTIDVSQFYMMGPSGDIELTLTSDICDQMGEYDNIFELTANPPISESGSYTLIFDPNNIDEALDVCGNPSLDFNLSFELEGPFFPPTIDLANDTIGLCVGNTIVLDATEDAVESYNWSTGETTAMISVDDEATYSVTVTNDCGSAEDDIEVSYVFGPPTVDLGDDVTLCEGEILTLNAYNSLSQYIWQDGSSESSFEVTEEGAYSVDIENDCAAADDEIFVEVIDKVELLFPLATALCPGDELVLDATSEAATYQWSTGSTDPILIIDDVGTYSITVTTPCEVVEWTTEVQVLDENTANLLGDTLLCQDEVLNVNITIANSTYLWEDGSTESIRTIDANGDYAVTVVAPCVTYEDEFSVNYIPLIDLDLGVDSFLCFNDIPLIASSPFSEYQWSNGSQDSIVIADQFGEYFVRVYNQCEDISDTITIFECERCELFAPNAFSPNFDGVNDEFKTFTDCELTNFDLNVFDRWGNLIFTATDPNEGWDGTFNGKKMSNDVFIWYAEYTVVENLIPRLILVKGDVSIVR
jgi:gliding motility-associated-like protein